MSGWRIVLLHLARTAEFPAGSSEHAYELVLPLDAEGHIDGAAFAASPARATVQRVWPGEGVRRGVILATRRGYRFSYAPGEADDEVPFHLEDRAFLRGEYITVTEADGTPLPFSVEDVRPLPAPRV